MKITAIKGKYVIAVSGGVDSITLLHLLNSQKLKVGKLELIVAHFDHGVRPDSKSDRVFVQKLAADLGLEFYYEEGHLGKDASEDQARKARYEFLRGAESQTKADGLITAHHQDDVIETAILNLIRGSGRKGLSSLSSSPKLIRPLLDYPKTEIIEYAKSHKLQWREDSTNQDTRYLRNYIRLNILPKLTPAQRLKLTNLIKNQALINKEIDTQLADVLKNQLVDARLPKLWLSSLDHLLSREVIAAWLRQNGLNSFDRATIERLAINLKTARPSKKIDVLDNWRVVSSKDDLALEHAER